MSNTHRVVILGGGFGGLYAARALKRAPVEVTLIDRRNFHLFQPLLYQVATGSLSPGEIAAPLRSVLSRQKNTRVLLGEAVDIDPSAKRVLLKDSSAVEYDSLIVATGSQSAYFGHDAWREWGPSLKSVEEATTIRHKILFAFEMAERMQDPQERIAWLTFVIVGAGATGVELAGALAEIANHTLKNDFRSVRPQDARIFVLDRADRALSTYPEDLSHKAERSLLKLGARVRGGVTVTAVDQEGVTFQTHNGSERLSARTVIWAAGVTVSDFCRQVAKRAQAETDKAGRIKVNPDLTIPNYPDIFVIGDLAAATKPDGTPLPGVAQVAMQGGSYAAKTIIRRVEGEPQNKPFRYFDKGDLAVIGRARAVANIFGVHISGFLAWLVWLFIHLMYIVEFQSRVLVFIQWGFEYITFGRGARLITGTAASDSVAGTGKLTSTASV
ncbi:MAG: NAD(P)/FAD-dependent oxidoreductase [Acidobacteriaceae bacterium]|nr:NAD(P)/FAD-dependent oxidoreductase [Acidobacteriaceae bacterium]MBV9780196.1 NAD(P)/FAD-dependent oxidoreductase [Acidobacteriaceae bacterium]